MFDFGCGALAMQFGLALAAADSLEELQKLPQVAVFSEDSSEPMKGIGWNIWHGFVKEIAKYPELSSLLETCQAMKLDDQGGPEAKSWLTALHIAYRENATEVRTALADRIHEYEPDLILVTSHPQSAQWAFSPVGRDYKDISDALLGARLVLDGEFEAASEFRSDLCDRYMDAMSEFLSVDDYWFVRNYLTKYPTGWVTTDGFRTSDFLYARD